MTKKYYLIISTLLFFISCQDKKQKPNNDIRPNVLFIAIDDLKPLLGCYGNEYIQTPHIDQLAKQSVVFSRAYTQQAVCGPSRASVLTGMRPDYTGVWDLKTRMRDVNPNILAMPQYFKENGYTTVAIGKVYDSRCVDKHYDKPSWSIPYSESKKLNYPKDIGEPLMGHYALDENKKLAEKYTNEAVEKGIKDVKNYVKKHVKPTTECADVPDEAYQDGQFTNNTIKYMRQFSKEDTPFFLAVGFKKPHLPFVAPKKYWDLYKRDEVPLAEYQEPIKNGVDIAYHNSPELRNYSDIPELKSFSDIFSDLLPESKQRELIHGYHASVSYIDAQVGKLISELKALKLYENTIIVLWGDHGWHLGDHALWCKHTNFENATRVPFILSTPKGTPGIYKYPVELLDIFPTLCAATNLNIPEHLQGKNLMPVMSQVSHKVKNYSVSQYRRGKNDKTFGYSIRTERYRLTLWMKDYYRLFEPFDKSYIIAGELYDYQNDPLEKENFYNDSKYTEVRANMLDYFSEFAAEQQVELEKSNAKNTIKK